jgi:exodeoxyribonuclease VII small subunit
MDVLVVRAFPVAPASRLFFIIMRTGRTPSFCYAALVPNQSKSAGQNTPAKSPPFEEALQKLEAVVEAMEADDLPLETLLAKYEEGAKLVRICQEKLAEAEVKIQQLEKTAAGEIKLKPFEAEAEE